MFWFAFCCSEKIWTKTNLERKVLILSYRLIHNQGKPSQELRAGSMEKHCLLVCPRVKFSYLSFAAQVHLPGDDGTTQSGLGPKASVRN